MPTDSVNLYLSIQCGSSEQTLVSLTDKTRALDKETQLLTQATEAFAVASRPLIEEQTKLQVQLKASQKTVNDLQKAYGEYGDEMMKLDLDKAIENHAKLKEELSKVNAQIGANQKTYKEYLETVRKGTLGEAGTGTEMGASETDGASSLGAVLGRLGVGRQLAALADQAAGAVLSSALGRDVGGIASSALSNAITGFSLGTAIAPGVGTAVGTVLGGLSGVVSGAIEQWSSQDEAFKDYYGRLYENVSALSGEMVSSGSAIAGGREQTRMAFARRFGGEELADEYLGRVEKMAASTNYDYDEIVGYAKLLLNSYEADDVLDVLQTLSDATAGLDLSSGDVNMMISGLSRMRTTGKATQEYLNYFRERGIDTDQALADSLGVDKSAVSGLVTRGRIGGKDAAQAILDYIQREFGGLSDDLAGTYDAMVDNLGDITASLQASGGDAYNALRKEGVEAEMDALGGELGDAIKEINAVVGENQARRENLEAQYMREALEAVLLGREGTVFSEAESAQLAQLSAQYQELKARYDGGDTDAGAELESLYEQAQALGKAYFDNSAEVQRLNDIEREEIEAIREATAGLSEATQASYRLSQELGKGLAAALRAEAGHGQLDVTLSETGGGGIAAASDSYVEYLDSNGVMHRHAYGLSRVPYDGYPALLHQGEQVLTASEARARDAGSPPIRLTVTGNSFVGTGEEMADQLAQIILRKLEQAAVAAAPR